MIRLTDAAILAYTKLRTHKVRTGITVGIAGILFGLVLAVIMVTQGIFTSIDTFGSKGLSERAVLTMSRIESQSIDVGSLGSDKKFINEVEALRGKVVARKTAAAKKFGITYDPATEDPSPISVDPKTKERFIDDTQLYSQEGYVAQAVQARQRAQQKPFDIKQAMKPYTSAKVLDDFYTVGGESFTFMRNGKETFTSLEKIKPENPNQLKTPTSLQVIDESVTQPFITNEAFDPSRGEVPVIIPYSRAMAFLGMEPLKKDASSKEKLAQLQEVRRRVGEVSGSFCYRNTASQQQIALVITQQEEAKQAKATPGYQVPSLLYELPAEDSCGAVRVKRDTRTATEKQQALNQLAYEKEIGTYAGDPVQYKITIRGVGVSGEVSDDMMTGVASMVQGIAGSTLGWDSNVWAVPGHLLKKLPSDARPAAVFTGNAARSVGGEGSLRLEEYLVDFANFSEARSLLLDTSNMEGENPLSAVQFGSNSLTVDEIKKIVNNIILWTLVAVSGVAVIIMVSMIGRTVAEGRRESAVFRAIGAKRSDIAAVYGVYTLFLSLRVVVFALILGGSLALIVELLYSGEASVGAHLAYGVTDSSMVFHLINLWSLQLLAVIGVMLATGLVASIIPILRSVRRNPINDMRDDT